MSFVRLLTVSIFLAVAPLASCAPQPEAPITVRAGLSVRLLRLDNGLVVAFNPEPTATSALVRVRYHAGSKDDPEGRAGLAHLVEHLTFDTSPRPGDADLYASLERVGAVDMNGITTADFTDFYATVPPSALAYTLWIEASRMAHPIEGLDDDALRKGLSAVRNELRRQAGAQPYHFAGDVLAAALFGETHPYGRMGRMASGDLDAVTVPELRAFAALHYQPSNATLVVSGRFDVEETTRLVTSYFGAIRSRPSPPRAVLPAPHLAKDAFASFGAPVRAKVVAVGWVLPPPEGDGYQEIALAERVIASRAYSRLATELALVDDVDVDLRDGHLGSMLVVAATLRPGADAQRVVSEVDRTMSAIAALGRTFEWDRFGELRLERATSVIVALESPSTRAWSILDDLEYAGGVRSTAQEIARIQRLHPSDVGGAVKQFVVDAHRAVVVLEPDPKAPPSGARR